MVQKSDKPIPKNTLLNSEEKRVLHFRKYSKWSEKAIKYHECGCPFTYS